MHQSGGPRLRTSNCAIAPEAESACAAQELVGGHPHTGRLAWTGESPTEDGQVRKTLTKMDGSRHEIFERND